MNSEERQNRLINTFMKDVQNSFSGAQAAPLASASGHKKKKQGYES